MATRIPTWCPTVVLTEACSGLTAQFGRDTVRFTEYDRTQVLWQYRRYMKQLHLDGGQLHCRQRTAHRSVLLDGPEAGRRGWARPAWPPASSLRPGCAAQRPALRRLAPVQDPGTPAEQPAPRQQGPAARRVESLTLLHRPAFKHRWPRTCQRQVRRCRVPWPRSDTAASSLSPFS